MGKYKRINSTNDAGTIGWPCEKINFDTITHKTQKLTQNANSIKLIRRKQKKNLSLGKVVKFS